MLNDKGETCVEWLQRVASTSRDAAARAAARHDIDEHMAFNRASNRRVRRSAWDLAAGVFGKVAGVAESEARLGSHVYRFHVYAEACDRRGVERPPHAIVTGVPVLGHRVPQVTRHGSRFLRT